MIFGHIGIWNFSGPRRQAPTIRSVVIFHRKCLWHLYARKRPALANRSMQSLGKTILAKIPAGAVTPGMSFLFHGLELEYQKRC